ncbi:MULTISPECIES: hypothetical protein [Marinobacter]|uniref:hypothetical protein n=1 Tax=Marinobacter TaxID=2742 RepID=UPI001245AA9E|nr:MULTISPECIES: hypothetical protein [Marinobacter]MBL3557415.1 hypothetical protein [Marinobacter sp. JB05H06]
MSYQDSNPERRNLVLLSLSIIVFYLAEGRLVSSDVRLQVVNVAFSRPEVLVATVWCLLVWFFYRYWLVHQGSWKKSYCQEMVRDAGVAKIAYARMRSKFELGEDYNASYFPNRHWLKFSEKGSGKLVYQHIFRGEAGQQLSQSKEPVGFLDGLLIVICSLWLFIRRPTLSTYFIPYILFVGATTLGVYHAL